uniref:Uncharacterized protein n=1 Tax=Panagrolaimus superbus TaxID=310955 RepID=A0A914Z6P9_9BILA
MENIDYWNIMDVDGMISNNSRPEIDPEWIKNLSKDDRIFCKCLNDKYYYDASIKKIVGSEENRKFLVTFAGLTARHDQTFNFVQACDSFLYMNWNTAKFVKVCSSFVYMVYMCLYTYALPYAFNAHCLEVIRNTMKETGANFDEKYDAAGSAFLRDFDKIDHAMITKNVRIRYPPRYSIAELINA